ncbi:hypothetical protein H9Q72_006287 [Fusarium xylarioides]|uniref:Major facilitator superfamily (MFS) profile domain-containing protein n=1 Tax=Fusarium xylarioides TaxID=221167 RepID=A0A9P7L607_9HYPO|nr:hypothetical protein H9Q72_006287 [Fusarium xylarioides]
MTILVGNPLDWAITATAGSGFLLFGYDQGVMLGLLTGTAFTNTFPEIDTTEGSNGSSSLQGTVVAIYEIRCFFSAIFYLIFSKYFSIGGQFMQQLSGINLITYYTPVIFQESVGISHNLSLLLAGFNGVAYFFSSLIPIWIIDRLGRRKLMMFAAAGQAVCMAVLAGTVSTGQPGPGIVAIVMLFLFIPAEYAPLAICTRAAALATASNWIFTFLIIKITLISILSIS